jgi:putative transposase
MYLLIFKRELYTVHSIVTSMKQLIRICFQSLQHSFVDWTKPASTSFILGTLTDLARSRSELVAENALLRKPLIILRRQVKRPACTKTDRLILVLLARASRAWKQALFIIQPETLLRWHRQGFQLYWKYKSRAATAKPKIAAETVALIQEMAAQNRRLVSGAHPWRIAQARSSRLQTNHSEIYEAGAHDSAKGTELGDLPTHSC